MNLKIILIAFACSCIAPTSDSANVLILWPLATKSVYGLLDRISQVVGDAGHNVTLISGSPKTESHHPNVTRLGIVGTEAEIARIVRGVPLFDQSSMVHRYLQVSASVQEISRVFLRSSIYQQLCNDNLGVKFDVAIVSSLHNAFSYPCVHRLGVPVIFYTPCKQDTALSLIMDSPLPHSYVPMIYAQLPSKMNLWQRTLNTMFHVGSLLHTYYVQYPAFEREIREALPSLQFSSLYAIERNVSLAFVNTHWAVDHVQPTVPRIIHTSGLHCAPAKPLTGKIGEFVEGSGVDGFIIFSLGSVISGKDMLDRNKQTWINIFSKLKLRVLWKFEEQVPDLPDNVLISQWLPQQDLLGHPKCRLFITQGGMFSLQEAIYHGVPIIGIPVWVDQVNNIEFATEKGIGESLNLDMEETEALHKINLILNNKRYADKIKKLSAVFKDRPMTASQIIVYWLEYILRHEGAGHLRNEALESLNLFQYLQIDVLAILFLVILLVCAILVALLRLFLNLCKSVLVRSNYQNKISKKKN